MKAKYKTVAMRRETYARLCKYRGNDETFDLVLNQLMDAWPLEEVSARELRTIRHRSRTFDGRDYREVFKALGDGKD